MLHRLKLAAIVFLTLVSAGQLILHNHSLIPEGRSPALVCSVCAFSADKAAAPPPVLDRPLVVAFVVAAPAAVAPVAGVVPILPSRAPPAIA